MQLAPSIIASTLSVLFNHSFKFGIFPDIFKTAKVVPIYKSGDKLEVNNYRPISLLSCFSKILEKLIFKRVSSFLDKHSILVPSQYGFRSDSSTSYAALDILTTSFENIKNNEFTGLVFLDLKKAFDTVCHERLLYKLNHNGVRGVAFDLFASYLNNRKQYVSIGAHDSSHQCIKNGVPQGSTLGPLLFLLYINDLPNSISCNPKLFADDTCLVINSNCISDLKESITSELSKIHSWVNANKLVINPSKSNLLVVPPKNRCSEYEKISVFYDNAEIVKLSSVKYLGIVFDSNLNFESHMNMLTKKLSRSVGILTKLKRLLPPKSLLQLYYAIVHPHLLYGLIVWGGSFKSYIDKLNILQNKAVKIIAGGRWMEHVTPFYKQLNLLKINELYEHEVAKFMFNFKSNKLPLTFSNYFTKTKTMHNRSTRSSDLDCYFLPRCKTSRLQRSVKFSGVKIWNSLPADIRKSSFYSFKRRHKKILLSKY